VPKFPDKTEFALATGTCAVRCIFSWTVTQRWVIPFHVQANLSVKTHSGINLGILVARADSFQFKPAKSAMNMGYHVSPSSRKDLERAALYLSRERAAVSCDCNGLIVSK
jgi:hypothetical protein